jgi:hypothetical protein
VRTRYCCLSRRADTPFKGIHELGDRHLRGVLDQEVYVVVLAVALDEPGRESPHTVAKSSRRSSWSIPVSTFRRSFVTTTTWTCIAEITCRPRR